MKHCNNIWVSRLNKRYSKREQILTEDQFFFLKSKHNNLIVNNPLFLRLVCYNTRRGLKIKTLNLYLQLVQIFVKMCKIMSHKRRRRVQRFIVFKNFEKRFQRMLTIKQLFLTKKLTRKHGRHKKFEYKFVALFKNKRFNQLLRWLRLLSFSYESRKYLTRLLFIYFDFLFFVKKSYIYRLHQSLRGDYYMQKKNKRKFYYKPRKKLHLGYISGI